MSNPQESERLNQLGKYFIDGANEILRCWRLEDQIQAVAYRWPCMPYLWFRKGEAQHWKLEFYYQMAERGVLLLPEHMSFMCRAHTNNDIEKALQVMDEFLCQFVERK